MFVTFFDTCMVTLVSLIVWKFSGYAVFLPWLFFATIDGLYLSSALTKVPDGAWFTLTISGILACLFLLWRFGKENQWRAEAEDRFRPSQLISKDQDGQLSLTEKWGGSTLSRIRGLGIYFDKTGVLTPTVFTQFVSKFGAIPEAMVFFHLHPVEAPAVPDEERYVASRLNAIPGCYRLVVKHGYMDEVISPDLALLVYEQVRKFLVLKSGGEPFQRENVSQVEDKATSSGVERVSEEATVASEPPQNEMASANLPADDGSEEWHEPSESRTGVDVEGDASSKTGTDANEGGVSPKTKTEDGGDGYISPKTRVDGDEKVNLPPELGNEEIRSELAHLDRAFASKVMYIIGKEQMRIKPSTTIPRRVALETFLWIRENTRAKIANLRLSMDRVVEVGFVKEI